MNTTQIQTNSLQQTIVIKNKLGLHARAAAAFVKIAHEFQSKIHLKKNTNPGWVDGKSVLSIMTLEASSGSQIIISAQGPDAKQALNKLIQLINDKFGEKE
ncbi:MAG: HPr family phosphocarrier protein [bacterium]